MGAAEPLCVPCGIVGGEQRNTACAYGTTQVLSEACAEAHTEQRPGDPRRQTRALYVWLVCWVGNPSPCVVVCKYGGAGGGRACPGEGNFVEYLRRLALLNEMPS